MSDDELREAFSACGPIHSVAVVPNRKAAQPKSYGFVNFLTPAARDAALGQSKVMRVRGQPVRVFPSDSKCQLFLAQLPRSITYERLAEVITQIAGPFVSLDLKQGKPPPSPVPLDPTPAVVPIGIGATISQI